MATVLFAWELGDGLGHVNRLLPIARGLAAEGHSCVFAVRNLMTCHAPVSAAGFRLFQVPFVTPYADAAVRGKQIETMGDILATVGYSDVPNLRAIIAGWQTIMDAVRPSLVVADYAPTAALCARGAVPVINIGDWFTLPPSGLPLLPRFRGGEPRVDEAKLLDVIARVQAERGRPTLPTLPSIFAGGARNFVVTLPDLDQHKAHRAHPAVGPLDPLPAPAVTEPTTDYFAYLSAGFGGTKNVLDALAASGLRGSVFLRDTTEGARQEWRAKGLVIHEKPQPMVETASNARFVIHHGGLGTLETVLALGRSQMLVPRHLEQSANARLLGHFGVAVAMRSGGKFQPEHVAQALRGLDEEPRFAEAARAKALAIQANGPYPGLAAVVGYCRDLLGGL